MNDLENLFFAECTDLLDSLFQGLRRIDESGDVSSEIDSVFRAVHSIKGAAGAFQMHDLVRFAHGFEGVLDGIRKDKVDFNADVLKLLYQSNDLLGDLLEDARNKNQSDAQSIDKLLSLLTELLPVESDALQEDASFSFTPISIFANQAAEDSVNITFSPSIEMYMRGIDVIYIVRSLSDFGDLTVNIVEDSIVAFSDRSSQVASLSWNAELVTSNTAAEIEVAFEFVEKCCDFSVEEFDTLPTEISPQVEEIIAENPSPSAVKKAENQKKPSESLSTIRVNLDKIDRLANMIGELVIKESMISQSIQFSGDRELRDSLDGLRQVVSDIQNCVMSIRAQPLKNVFDRMFRIAREAAEFTKKNVRLEISGEDTEVDKAIIERLVDPLTHMIRNSIDHGVESSEVRAEKGKPPQGVISISASQKSGRLQIDVQDDGAGLDRKKILEIALRNKVIESGEGMSDHDIDQLVFLPGFTSKSSVSEISGRGVGLDVVRREIGEIGGRVSIESALNAGTKFIISVPLTMAVLDGMVVVVDEQVLVIPTLHVLEVLQVSRGQMVEIGPEAMFLESRGDLIEISNFINHPSARSGGKFESACVAIIIKNEVGVKAAIFVDSILDNRQVVIKSLEQNYGKVGGISAATILGDGKVALILDPDQILSRKSA